MSLRIKTFSPAFLISWTTQCAAVSLSACLLSCNVVSTFATKDANCWGLCFELNPIKNCYFQRTCVHSVHPYEMRHIFKTAPNLVTFSHRNMRARPWFGYTELFTFYFLHFTMCALVCTSAEMWVCAKHSTDFFSHFISSRNKTKSSYRFHSTLLHAVLNRNNKNDSLPSKNLFWILHLCFKLFGISQCCFQSTNEKKNNQIPKEWEMKRNEEKKNLSEKGTEQIDNFIFISYRIKFILVISLFIRGMPKTV